ncbi:MAG TPA: hypothetical protein VHT24_07000 [Pseudacidobacterium sp.]|nr:hypothetical protein [Pseudacidobacterium sp.]
MQHILMDYAQEEGGSRLEEAAQEHWSGAYPAYMDTITKDYTAKSSSGLQPMSLTKARLPQ